MKKQILLGVLGLVVAVALATPPAHADGIDFTSASGGGTVSYNGTATGALLGSKITLTSVAFTGGPEHAVTGHTCSGGACGLLTFTSGSFVSSTATSFTFGSGGSFSLSGSVTGGSAITLVSGVFAGDVNVTQVSSTVWSLVAPVSITSVDPSLTALFPSVFAPTEGAFSNFIIRFKLTKTGGFSGTVTSPDLFISSVPEPSSILLLGSGFVAAGAILGRRKRKK